MMFRNARLRLTAWYAGSLAAVLVAVGLAAFLILRNEIDAEIDDSLASIPGDVLPGLVPAEAGLSRREGDTVRGDRFPGPRQGPGAIVPTDVFTLVLGPQGEQLFNSRNVDLTGWPLAKLSTSADETPRLLEFSAEGEHFRVRIVRTDIARGGPAVVLVGRSLATRDHQLEVLVAVLGAGGLAGVALAAVGGFVLAGRTLSPIQRTLETQRRFVSDASHELRTPIAVVSANADVLLGHSDETVDENIDHVAAISDEARHMSRLVADLLTLARADEGSLNLELGPVDAAGVVSSLIDSMNALADDRGVTLVAQTTPSPTEADPNRLRQVLTILVDNALKYTPRGGSVTVTCGRRGSTVELAVADNGPGIAPGDQGRIFDRFYRIDAARTAGGAGLGLAIARTIAEAHGGRLTVDSTLGKGSTFTLRLPARPSSR